MRNITLASRPRLAIACLALWSSITSVSSAADWQAVQEEVRSGNFDQALATLEPLLNDRDEAAQRRARALAAQVLHLRGEEHFRQTRIAEAIADFERELKLQPHVAAEHWQLGIAYYYASEFEKGARQFELHQTVNPQDVENAAWHFLCIARSADGSLETARSKLIAVTRDQRVPMMKVQEMLAGKATVDDVLQTGKGAGETAKFYADLYAGLYYEAIDQKDDSRRHVKLAAENPAARDNYMGDVARVHATLRERMPRH